MGEYNSLQNWQTKIKMSVKKIGRVTIGAHAYYSGGRSSEGPSASVDFKVQAMSWSDIPGESCHKLFKDELTAAIEHMKQIGPEPKIGNYTGGSDSEDYKAKYKAYKAAGDEYKLKRDSITNELKNRCDEKYDNEFANTIMRIRTAKHKDVFFYKRNAYCFDRPDYSDEEMLLQIMDLEDEERRKFERLRNKFSKAEQEEKSGKRPAIPEDVRIAVWRRDEGKCTKCGSRENLEYDHIIPISKGGNNTVRNIELLCEACNRSKRDNIQ